MSKKLIIFIILSAIVVCGSILFYIYFINQTQTNEIISPIRLSPGPTDVPVSYTTYENPSGFSFEYPDTVNLKEIEVENYYANIELTSEDQGSIHFMVSDTKSTSVDDWIKDNAISKKNAEVADVLLADIDGAQIATSGGIQSIFYDQGALFNITIDWKENQSFWQSVYDTIISSFEFNIVEKKPDSPVSAGSSGGSTGSDIIFEGEEIIE